MRSANKKAATRLVAADRLLIRDANPAPVIATDTGSIAEPEASVKKASTREAFLADQDAD